MSRIGKLPIAIPAGVTVEVNGQVVTVKGAKETLSQEVSKNVTVTVENNQVLVTRNDESKDSNAKQGLYRQLINNMVVGVSAGFTKSLTVKGVGYKLNKQGNKLVMNLGYSHPVEMDAPEGITFDVPNANQIIVRGIDKELVGQTAAVIRTKRPPEVYRGKGIKYAEEVIRRKEGKAGKK